MNGATILTWFKANTKDFDDKTKGMQSKISGIAKGIGTAFLAGTGVAVGALGGLVKESVDAFASVEQSIGGVETLFKDNADMVMENAKNAFKTAGISADQYMQQVTSFSASLLQSTAGDTKKAGEIADQALIDMADNANKFGSSMESIQNAYQGFAKQNYTMLDNLKLGYGGTKTEMERLLADAEKLSGVKYDISNLGDVYNAIHVIQENLGVTGTTAKEASETISGSMASAKASFQNFIAGQGGIEDVIETFITAGKNISKAIVKLLPDLMTGIVELVNGLIPLIPEFINALFPGIIDGAVMLLNGLVNAMPEIIKILAGMLPTIIESLINGLIIVIQTLAEMLPELMPVIIDAILGIIPVLIDNLPLFIEAGFKLIGGLVAGIINSIPILVARLAEIGVAFWNYLKTLPETWKKAGKAMLEGLWNGIKSMKDWVVNKVKDIGKSILGGLKSILGIKSPSKEFALIGKFSVLGYTEALDDMQKDVQKQVGETFGISPQLANSSSLNYTPNVNVKVYNNYKTDPLGQMVNDIKTFSGGSKNDFNYGMSGG